MFNMTDVDDTLKDYRQLTSELSGIRVQAEEIGGSLHHRDFLFREVGEAVADHILHDFGVVAFVDGVLCQTVQVTLCITDRLVLTAKRPRKVVECISQYFWL